MLRVTAGLAALVALATWAYGPDWPPTESELRTAYAQQRAIVCGASYGIGAELAYALARANASLILAARSERHLQEVARQCRELGAARVVVHSTDLSTKENCRGLVDTAETAFGGVDVLVLNHIISHYEDWTTRIMRAHREGTLDEDLAFADKLMSVNILSYIYLSSYALPALARAGGRVIALGSFAGKVGLPRVALYSASKHAVFGYFDSLRHDLLASPDQALQGVSITTGVLGSFDTETARDNAQGKLPHLLKWHPPDEAALAVLRAGARRWHTVFVPWGQTRLPVLLHPLMPRFLGWAIAQFMLSGEGDGP